MKYLVVGLVAWIVVAESVFITQATTKTKSPISKAAMDHEKAEEEEEVTTYRKPQEEEEEDDDDEEALLVLNRLNAELFAKIDILDSETFAQEFDKIARLYIEELAKIDEKLVKKHLLEKDIHIPDISVQDKQLLRYIMTNCVDQYYLNDHLVPLPPHPHYPKNNVSSSSCSDYGDFCIEFFSKIEKFNGSLHKLEPAHVDALKEYYYYYARSCSPT